MMIVYMMMAKMMVIKIMVVLIHDNNALHEVGFHDAGYDIGDQCEICVMYFTLSRHRCLNPHQTGH